MTLDQWPAMRLLTDDQFGVVSRRQAEAAGLTPAQLRHLLGSGRWQQLHRGVYATFTGTVPFEASVWAAVLRAGEGAVASHRTAAFLDRLVDGHEGPVQSRLASNTGSRPPSRM